MELVRLPHTIIESPSVRECDTCGTEFEALDGGRFCSLECAGRGAALVEVEDGWSYHVEAVGG